MKFDGVNLKDGTKVIANVKGSTIREGSGFKVLCNIKNDEIREGAGFKVMFNIKGDDIRQGNGFSKVATMKQVDATIDGPGKNIKAALWLYFCR